MTGKSDNQAINLSLPMSFDSLDRSSKPGYILTNRRNLIEYLSSGLIKPATWHSPHYGDLGSYVRNGIPVLLEPPSERLIERTIDTKDFNFPVIIEVNTSGIQGFDKFINSNLNDINIRIFPGAIPIMPGMVVHLRSIDDYNEFRIRRYPNLPSGYTEFATSPRLFSGAQFDPDHVLSVLSTEEVQTVGHMEENFTGIIDSMIGALQLLFHYSSLKAHIPLVVPHYLLDRYAFSAGKKSILESTSLPNNFKWIDLVLSVFPESFGFSGKEFHLHENQIDASEDKKSVGEWRVFRAAFYLLCRSNPDNFVWELLLQKIIDELLVEEKTKKLDHKTVEEYQKRFALIRKIFDGMEDSEKFYKLYDPNEFPITFGLFIFLQGRNPVDVINTLKDQDRLNEVASAAAIMFSGALTGRTLFPVDYYPEKEAVILINEIHADLLNKFNSSIVPSPLEGLEATKVGTIERLMLGNLVLIHRDDATTESEQLKSEAEMQKKSKKYGVKAKSKVETNQVTIKPDQQRAVGKTSGIEETISDAIQEPDSESKELLHSDTGEILPSIIEQKSVPGTDKTSSMGEVEPLMESETQSTGQWKEDKPTASPKDKSIKTKKSSTTGITSAASVKSSVDKVPLMEALRRRILSSDFTDMNKLEAKAAVELCRAAHHEGWLITVIQLHNQLAVVDGQKPVPEIRINGFVVPTYRIASQSRENFRAWLKGIAPDILEGYRTSALEAIIIELKIDG